jgi:hypothetical protein
MTDGTRSVLLRDEGPTTHVRVRPGWVLQSRDDHAPTVPRYFLGGQDIPNLDAEEAVHLIAMGAVEIAV